MRILTPFGAAFAAAALLLHPVSVLAQAQGPGWFVPGGQPPAAPAQPRPAAPRPQPPQQPRPAPQPIAPQASVEPEPDIQIQLPPVPDLPALPKGSAPPTPVIGVLGVPDIMRVSTAAQQIERVIGERREKLNEDAQKEQATWRDLQQALANQRSGLNAEQIRARERDLQERITNAQKQFRDRNRIIQESAQYGLAQIERTLIGVIRQVAESRGMNLVLHRAQVALNVNEFDITEQVAEQINKIMPTATIPPDGVSPLAAQAAGGVQPASALPTPPPTPPPPATPPAPPRR